MRNKHGTAEANMPKGKSRTAPSSRSGQQRYLYALVPSVGVAVAAAWLIGRPQAQSECIDRVHGLDEALAHFRSASGRARPALITGLTDNRKVRQRWTPEFLRQDPHGGESVNVQQRYALAQTGGNTKTGAELPFTLGTFISEALPTYAGSSNPPYVFDSKSFFASKGGMKLLQSFQMSPVLDFSKSRKQL